ncbi:putative RDD family membrane protein YckC [Kitasatospora sp. MAA4]|uniref:RDD family protein n=1 Tax=Kitasatospora sp. MAA4 TaxID=3035093 RepID=UPI002473AF0C|nr:RDD family protein [Kitasatospora sp. MAA4]MDH6132115.1 putative RDD family membrane protein YckC [Kitasatospora sp. MAA4]
MTYAHWSVRVVAHMIDLLACGVPNVLAGVFDPRNVALQVGMGAVSLTLFGYNRWYLGGRTGQSWGKHLMDTRMVRLDGSPEVGVLRAFLRDVAHLLDTLPCCVGWFWPIWDAKRQTFADKLASTAVTTIP